MRPQGNYAPVSDTSTHGSGHEEDDEGQAECRQDHDPEPAQDEQAHAVPPGLGARRDAGLGRS